MKKYFNTIVFAALILSTWSCSKDVEDVPLERYTEEYLWNTSDSLGNNASQFLVNIYNYTPNGFNRIGNDFLAAASDDAVSSALSVTSVQRMATGGITPFANPDNVWGNYYAGIRRATMFINNIDKVPLATKLPSGAPLKAAWKAEARFLRALFYFELVKRYGGVPIVGDEIRTLNDNVEIPRSSFAACIQYIVDECDLAKTDLRLDPVLDADAGRVTKGAAYALKARALLYAASPLYNGGNIQENSEYTGYSNYMVERWKLAADAAKEIMDLNSFQLLPNFKNVFITYPNREVIFARQGGNNTNVETTNGPIGYAGNSQGRTSPTQELVDSFGMLNGSTIADPAYDPTNPYKNRDPRLAATVLYNGAQWLNRTLETFEGGFAKPGGVIQQTKTGYYLRKFMGNFENANAYSNVNRNFILFRYAEVLLNYAEAQNEYLTSPNAEVRAAVELIRQRAGLNPYQLPVDLTKEQMREIIQNERRKELAFEEHRFWDIRRWKIAGNVYNKPLHGMLIQKGTSGVLSYQEVPVLTTVFTEPKMYFYPIPYDEVVKNSNMKQNPGW